MQTRSILPGIDTDSFTPVCKYLDESMQSGVVAGGSVIVFHDGKIVLQTGFGYTDLESKAPFLLDTPVAIASISKPMVGTTLNCLAESELLDLEVPVSEYLPAFTDLKLESGAAVKRAPSVAELLTHTSGIRASEAPGGRIWLQDWTHDKTLEYVVEKVASA